MGLFFHATIRHEMIADFGLREDRMPFRYPIDPVDGLRLRAGYVEKLWEQTSENNSGTRDISCTVRLGHAAV